MIRPQPLGDAAALCYFPDADAAQRFAFAAGAAAIPGRLDVVAAYASVAVHFDPAVTTFAQVASILAKLNLAKSAATPSRVHVLPCCYELQLDLDRVAKHVGLTTAEVIRLHAATEYDIRAIGFCPGFPYLGDLPAELSGVPRLDAPRLRVDAGSVGLTGKQTGVYPLVRPGGWNLIGRTPLVIVDPTDGYFPLHVGDRVRFEPIDQSAFDRLFGTRLQ